MCNCVVHVIQKRRLLCVSSHVLAIVANRVARLADACANRRIVLQQVGLNALAALGCRFDGRNAQRTILVVLVAAHIVLLSIVHTHGANEQVIDCEFVPCHGVGQQFGVGGVAIVVKVIEKAVECLKEHLGEKVEALIFRQHLCARLLCEASQELVKYVLNILECQIGTSHNTRLDSTD